MYSTQGCILAVFTELYSGLYLRLNLSTPGPFSNNVNITNRLQKNSSKVKHTIILSMCKTVILRSLYIISCHLLHVMHLLLRFAMLQWPLASVPCMYTRIY